MCSRVGTGKHSQSRAMAKAAPRVGAAVFAGAGWRLTSPPYLPPLTSTPMECVLDSPVRVCAGSHFVGVQNVNATKCGPANVPRSRSGKAKMCLAKEDGGGCHVWLLEEATRGYLSDVVQRRCLTLQRVAVHAKVRVEEGGPQLRLLGGRRSRDFSLDRGSRPL